MLFHVPAPERKGIAPKQVEKGEQRPAAEWEFSPPRALVAFAFFLVLLALSLAAKYLGWDQGATALLHMSEVVFGGLAGILFGESMALK